MSFSNRTPPADFSRHVLYCDIPARVSRQSISAYQNVLLDTPIPWHSRAKRREDTGFANDEWAICNKNLGSSVKRRRMPNLRLRSLCLPFKNIPFKIGRGCWIKSEMRFVFVIWHIVQRRHMSIGFENTFCFTINGIRVKWEMPR